MFGDDFKSFVPAADVGEWVEATFFGSSSPVANPEHEYLANAHIDLSLDRGWEQSQG
jgi:hypothetical protein